MYVCMHVCMHVCMYVCIRMYVSDLDIPGLVRIILLSVLHEHDRIRCFSVGQNVFLGRPFYDGHGDIVFDEVAMTYVMDSILEIHCLYTYIQSIHTYIHTKYLSQYANSVQNSSVYIHTYIYILKVLSKELSST